MYTSVAMPARPAQHHAMATTAVRHVPLGTAGTASCVSAALAEKTIAAMTHQAVSSPPARNSNQEPRPHASQVMHCGSGTGGGWRVRGDGMTAAETGHELRVWSACVACTTRKRQ